jgi:hypothetical protein
MPRISGLPSADEARHQGGPSDNEELPVEERTAEVRTPVQEGPKVGKAGEYLPGTYKTSKGNTREDR